MSCAMCKRKYKMKKPLCKNCETSFIKSVDKHLDDLNKENEILQMISDFIDGKQISVLANIIIETANNHRDENGDYEFYKVIVHEKHFKELRQDLEYYDIEKGYYFLYNMILEFNDGNYKGQKFNDFMFELK